MRCYMIPDRLSVISSNGYQKIGSKRWIMWSLVNIFTIVKLIQGILSLIFWRSPVINTIIGNFLTEMGFAGKIFRTFMISYSISDTLIRILIAKNSRNQTKSHNINFISDFDKYLSGAPSKVMSEKCEDDVCRIDYHTPKLSEDNSRKLMKESQICYYLTITGLVCVEASAAVVFMIPVIKKYQKSKSILLLVYDFIWYLSDILWGYLNVQMYFCIFFCLYITCRFLHLKLQEVNLLLSANDTPPDDNTITRSGITCSCDRTAFRHLIHFIRSYDILSLKIFEYNQNIKWITFIIHNLVTPVSISSS